MPTSECNLGQFVVTHATLHCQHAGPVLGGRWHSTGPGTTAMRQQGMRPPLPTFPTPPAPSLLNKAVVTKWRTGNVLRHVLGLRCRPWRRRGGCSDCAVPALALRGTLRLACQARSLGAVPRCHQGWAPFNWRCHRLGSGELSGASRAWRSKAWASAARALHRSHEDQHCGHHVYRLHSSIEGISHAHTCSSL